MKLIVAIVKPFKIQEIADTLAGESWFPGMTVLDGRGFGRERQQQRSGGDPGWQDSLVPHHVMLVGAPDGSADRIARRIREVAHTGRPGDGKVFVLDMSLALAITTGEEGDAALG